MRKEIGKWFRDIAKYVATAVVISSFLGGLQQRWLMYVLGITTVLAFLFLGMYIYNSKKINKKK